MKPCHGIYADIQHKELQDSVFLSRNGKGTARLFGDYLKYRRSLFPGYFSYFKNITQNKGQPFLNNLARVTAASCYHYSIKDCKRLIKKKYATCGGDFKCQTEITEYLPIVEIYFDTPTFDVVTKDAKTNNITKISMIGGTLGLLTGFSILSGAEIVYFLVKMVLKIIRDLDYKQ